MTMMRESEKKFGGDGFVVVVQEIEKVKVA